MPLIYVTGPSGAGKSTVRNELMKRGYEAHDTDEDGMSAWYNIETGEQVEYPDKANRTSEWYKKHAARVLPERVKLLAERAKDKLIFLCGIPSNDMELAEHFSKIICLVIDEETMKQRVATRNTNNFGKSPAELELMLYWHGKVLERYKNAGAVMIDAQRPLDKVIGDILASSESVPVITIHLPQYRIDAEPNYKSIGKIVDDELRKYFTNRTIVARGIGSSEHSGKTIDELVEIIKHDGTDRYDPYRKGDRYETIDNKHIDVFGFRRKVGPHMQLFKDVVYGFYHSALGIHGKAVRIDILIIYDAAKVKTVLHQYEGRADKKRDGFVFRDPTRKAEAVLGIIKVL
jgi:dephospho-CoA kinase